jgi:hypothetical protein
MLFISAYVESFRFSNQYVDIHLFFLFSMLHLKYKCSAIANYFRLVDSASPYGLYCLVPIRLVERSCMM